LAIGSIVVVDFNRQYVLLSVACQRFHYYYYYIDIVVDIVRFPEDLMKELMALFGPGVVPHYFVIKTFVSAIMCIKKRFFFKLTSMPV
jgi:hypothetical protein